MTNVAASVVLKPAALDSTSEHAHAAATSQSNALSHCRLMSYSLVFAWPPLPHLGHKALPGVPTSLLNGQLSPSAKVQRGLLWKHNSQAAQDLPEVPMSLFLPIPLLSLSLHFAQAYVPLSLQTQALPTDLPGPCACCPCCPAVPAAPANTVLLLRRDLLSNAAPGHIL